MDSNEFLKCEESYHKSFSEEVLKLILVSLLNDGSKKHKHILKFNWKKV